MNRSRTKLVCTIGPASVERVGDLVAAGMDVARINFSHGTPEEHKNYVHAVRAAAHSARRSVAVMADLPGPKIRLGRLTDDVVVLESGATFTLRPAAPPEGIARRAETQPVSRQPETQPEPVSEASKQAADRAEAERAANEGGPEPAAEDATDGEPTADDSADSEPAAADVAGHLIAAMAEEVGDASGASVSVSDLAAKLEPGDRVLLADGAVELRVTGTHGAEVQTEVVHGGQIRTRSGVNIPSSRLNGDGLTHDDRAAVPRALEMRVDLIAQSFIRNADDVRALKQLLPSDGPRLVAKIETQAAVDAFDEIARVADGIMVARGDLGVDIPFEEVPLVQKDLVRRAADADRFSIVATQMLESMIGAARPTRAEASDVANAVLDGADAVMLSAETAIGAYPIEALQAMARICVAAERARADTDSGSTTRPTDPVTHATATILAATAATSWTDVGAIWCFTRTGHTAEKLSTTRPRVPIVAFTLSPIVARRLAVRRGVIPMVLPANAARGEPLIDRMENAWRAQRDHQEYESVILLTTSNQQGGINRLEVQRLKGGAGRAPQPARPARAAPAQPAPRPAPPPREAQAAVAAEGSREAEPEHSSQVEETGDATQAADQQQAVEEPQVGNEPQAADETPAAADEMPAAELPPVADEPEAAVAERVAAEGQSVDAWHAADEALSAEESDEGTERSAVGTTARPETGS